ncbi:MAG: hypothetical protein KAT88_06420 [Spirochaetes bacterium]|nr:hypothetical protein [Spirochaetota bacterium]
MMKMIRSIPILRIDPEMKVSPLINPMRESDFARKRRNVKNRMKLPIPSLIFGLKMTN